MKYQRGSSSSQQNLNGRFGLAVRVHDERESGEEPWRSVGGLDRPAVPGGGSHKDLDPVLRDETEAMDGADREVD